MSGGETSLSGYDNASQALSYTPGQEQVYLNGILLVRADDYTATNGTSITGLSALSASDFVQVNCYNNFSVASVPSQNITGTIANNQLANSAITINGSAISLGGTVTLAGDIESVTATSPLTGGGSTGALTVGIQSASTTQSGSVQLSDSTSTTSSVLAATPTAVKSAYDLANGAIPKTLTTTTGDIIYASGANTPARLGIGSTSQVLTVSGGVPAWATPAGGGGGSMTLLSTTTLTGSSVTLSSISSAYKDLKIVIRNPQMGTSGWGLFMRMNGDTTADNHYWAKIGTDLYGAPGWNATKISVSNDNGTNLQDKGMIVIDIPDYANTTTWKMSIASALTVADNPTTGLQYQTTQGSYRSLSAISSLQFLSGSGSLTSGTIYLYGVN
jgi:hypothetical protein